MERPSADTGAAGRFVEPLQTVQRNTDEERAAAALFVAGRAETVDDARELLLALGLVGSR